MKKLFYAIIFTFSFLDIHAQYSTPGTGINWNFDSLVANSNGVVTATLTGYRIHKDLDIDTNDVVSLLENRLIELDSNVLITVYGTFICNPYDSAGFRSVDTSPAKIARGFRFEESNQSVLRKTLIESTGGIKLISSNLFIDSCIFRFNTEKYATSAALDLFKSNPVISNSMFIENRRSAIASGANGYSSPKIINNYFYRNSTENTNRPQINLGPAQSADDTILIKHNLITGFYTMAGGIALLNLTNTQTNAIIDSNYINNNRYGIASIGQSLHLIITNNLIENNNIQNDPIQGGSGLNFNTTSGINSATVTGNIITGNLWGATIQGIAQPNFGDTALASYNPGLNFIAENGNNNQIFGIYNNTPNMIKAMNNCWGLTIGDSASIENCIFHHTDSTTLGNVLYMPFINCGNVGIDEKNSSEPKVYPNPATEVITIESGINSSIHYIYIMNIMGQTVYQNDAIKQGSAIMINIQSLPKGVYILRIGDKKEWKNVKIVKE